MEAPTCPICKAKHYGVKHVWGDSVVAKAQKTVPTVMPPKGFDRRAYQKAYMRFYRRRQALVVQTAQAVLEGVADRWPRG